MTAGVYGVVAGIIKMDDMGAALLRVKGANVVARALRSAGEVVSHAAPKIIKTIGALGTAAMFVVGGTMLVHGIPGGEHMVSNALGVLGTNPLVQIAGTVVANAAIGVVAGLAAVPVAKIIGPPLGKLADQATKFWHTIRPQKAPRPEDREQDEPAPQPSPDALKTLPDITADLNAAANSKKPQSTVAPADVRAQPAAASPQP